MKRRTFLKAAVATAAAAVLPQTEAPAASNDLSAAVQEVNAALANRIDQLGFDCSFDLRVEHRSIPAFGTDIPRTVYISNDGGLTWEISEVEFEFVNVGHGPYWTEVEVPDDDSDLNLHVG